MFFTLNYKWDKRKKKKMSQSTSRSTSRSTSASSRSTSRSSHLSDDDKKKPSRTKKVVKLTGSTKRKSRAIVDPTREQIMAATTGYFMVKPDKFERLQSGDRIKYLTEDNRLMEGGYIWYKKTGVSGTFWMIGAFRNVNMSPGVFKFSLYWDKIKILWKQIDVETDLVVQSLDNKQHQLDNKQHQLDDIFMFLANKFGAEFTAFMATQEINRRKKSAPTEARGRSKSADETNVKKSTGIKKPADIKVGKQVDKQVDKQVGKPKDDDTELTIKKITIRKPKKND